MSFNLNFLLSIQGDFRTVSREQLMAYQNYMRVQQEALSGARYPSYHKSRSPLLPGAIDQNQPEQLEDSMAANAAPLELRRVNTPSARNSIPQSLQSPGDRATGELKEKGRRDRGY